MLDSALDFKPSLHDLSRFNFRQPRTVLDLVAQMYYLPSDLHPQTIHGHSVKDQAIEDQAVCSLADLEVRINSLAKRRNVIPELLATADLVILKEFAFALGQADNSKRSTQELRRTYNDSVHASCFDAIDFAHNERRIRATKLKVDNAKQKQLDEMNKADWWKNT